MTISVRLSKKDELYLTLIKTHVEAMYKETTGIETEASTSEIIRGLIRKYHFEIINNDENLTIR